MRSTLYRCLAPLLLLFLATCKDSVTAPAPEALRPLRTVVAGEPVGPVFLFLPPLGPDVQPTGVFDGSLQPVVEVCEWTSGSCAGAIVARFTTGAGRDQIHVSTKRVGESGKGKTKDQDPADGSYGVDWKTKQSTIVVAKVYRLRVLLDDAELAHVDVQFSAHAPDADGQPGSGGVITWKKDKSLAIKFWIAKPPQHITMVVGRGVTGNPAGIDAMFQFGSSILYSYQATDGFENVQVTLDGIPVPLSGTVVANATHVVYVTAERIVTLTPELQPLYQAAHGLLSAADPVAATQAYLNQAADYVRTHDADAASVQLRDVHYLAFDQLVDSAAARRLDAALANHFFEIERGSAAAFGIAVTGTNSTSLATSGLRFSLSPASASPDSLERTVFMYVNGIWTSLAEELETVALVGHVKDEITRFRGNPLIGVGHYYNRTRSVQVPTKLEAERYCVANFLSQVRARIKDVNAAGAYMVLCMAEETYRRWSAADLVESARQTLNIVMRTPAAEADAQLLAGEIQRLRAAGSHVILVPHSQGNLMAIQAIHRLRDITGEYDPQRDSTCIGAVSLASPLSHGWELPDHYLVPVVVSGDPVPNLIPDGNTWNRINTDSSIAILLEVVTNGSFQRLLALHSVNSSYLTAQARDSVKAGMTEVYDACAIDHLDVKPFTATLRPGESQLLFPSLINKYGDTLAGRLVDWTSSNGASVIVSRFGTNGLIGGAAAGTSLVVATNHRASAGVPVTVLQPLLPIFPSSYSASMPAGFEGANPAAQPTGAPQCPPMPPITFTVKFLVSGRVAVFDDFDGFPHVIAQIYSELFSPSGVSIRGGPIFVLFWNADRTQLSGTVVHEIFTCDVGYSERTDAITFNRTGS